MPLKLIPPKAGRNPVYRVRGTHLGIYVDRTTGVADERKARKLLIKWRDEIESGQFRPREAATFAGAAKAYILAGGERRFMKPIVDHFGPSLALADIDQKRIDDCAQAVMPDASPATKNRQVYTPISSVLRHFNIDINLKRPKGAQGVSRTEWLWPEEAAKLFTCASKQHARFGVFLIILCYTGMRLSEALRIERRDLRLDESFLFCGVTKNGDPRPVHLPPAAVSALRRLTLPTEGRIFRFSKAGYLYGLMREATAAAGVTASFHTLRHTYATWMTRYAGMDARQLVGTGAWRDIKSATRYAHVVVTEESMRADQLPDVTVIGAKSARNSKK